MSTVTISGQHKGREVALDDRDAAILAERQASIDAVEGPRNGDYLRMPDGSIERVSHVYPADWGEMHGVQPTHPKFGHGSLYLGKGYLSYSGSLGNWIAQDRLTLTDETHIGPCWFFHHDWWEAHNGVTVRIPFRVYEVAAS